MPNNPRSSLALPGLSGPVPTGACCTLLCRLSAEPGSRLPSLMRLANNPISLVCGMVSKYLDRSASTTSSLPALSASIMALSA